MPGGVELATARYRVRAGPHGERGLVRAWALEENRQYTDQPAPMSGLTEYYGSVVDKPHRAYHYMQPDSMRIDPLTGDHPADRYWRYFEVFADGFIHRVERTQDAVDYLLRQRTLQLRTDVELHPDGGAWVCSLELSLPPNLDEYW